MIQFKLFQMNFGKYLVECMMIAVHDQLAGSVTVFSTRFLLFQVLIIFGATLY